MGFRLEIPAGDCPHDPHFVGNFTTHSLLLSSSCHCFVNIILEYVRELRSFQNTVLESLLHVLTYMQGGGGQYEQARGGWLLIMSLPDVNEPDRFFCYFKKTQ